jgi:hypothetical protein
MRRLLAAVLAAAGLLSSAATAQALQTGIADEQPATLTHPLFRELGFTRARVIIPWNAALVGDKRAVAWLDAARANGIAPLVTLDHVRGTQCPDAPCPAPSPSDLEAAVRALRSRWPNVTELTAWNEPNHRSEPTWQRPELAAAYYAAARRACPSCTVVAGDLLDDANMRSWLRAYRAALPEDPAVWGVHNYFDATYFSTTGADTMLAETHGQLWLTETGGIVRHTTDGGGLPYDEGRAADAIRWLFGLAAGRPRIARMYLYQWQSSAGATFDAGLLNLDGSERPGMGVVRAAVGRGGSTAVANRSGLAGVPAGGAGFAPGAIAPMARLAGRGVRLDLAHRRITLRLSCVSAGPACRGRVSVITGAGAGRPLIARRFDVPAGTTRTVRLPVSAAALRAIGRRTVVGLRIRTGDAPPQRSRVALRRARGR